MLVGLALNSTIASQAKFDRKNYFYPDLAKAYQITQYDQPLAIGGQVVIDGQTVELVRAHLEEDVGKLSHSGNHSLVNFNKGGTPLLEIVSKPMIHSAAQARAYVQTIRQIVRYIGVNEGNLERGTMRADVNVSLQVPGSWQYAGDGLEPLNSATLNNRVEIKNLNSFKAIERAVEYEVKRQAERLDKGQTIDQETRGWDEAHQKTITQRSKEEAHDYRYFPEPDLPPLEISDDWINQVRQQLVELPLAKKQRFIGQYQLSDYDASLLVEERTTADWFEQAVAELVNQANIEAPAAAKQACNWMIGELARLANDRQMAIDQSQLQPAQLATIIKLVLSQEISAANAKQLAEAAFDHQADINQLVQDRGFKQISDTAAIETLIDQVIAGNPDAVANIQNGKLTAAQFLVGQVMKLSKGQAKPDTVRQLLSQKLNIDLG